MDGPYEGTIRDGHKDLFLVSMKEGKTIMVIFNFTCFLLQNRYPNSSYNISMSSYTTKSKHSK